MIFTSEQRLWIHGQKNHRQTPYRTMCTLYRQRFGQTSTPPSRNGYRRIAESVEMTSNLTDRPRSGRPRTATTEENTYRVMGSVLESPKLGTRKRAAVMGQSRTTVQRILKDLEQYPYRHRRLHELKPQDYNNRFLFSHWFISQCNADPHFEDLILYTDEAHCELNGRINSHNSVHWGTERPREVLQTPLHSPKVTVWCALSSSGILGPYFFQENGVTVTVTGDRYRRMLSHRFYPDLMDYTFSHPEETHLFPSLNDSLVTPHRWWFMQDGARPHLPARNWITSKFSTHTIGEGLTHPWPARSPDLTPLDFFFWGWLKDEIYRDGPIATIPELKAKIIHCCRTVPDEFLVRACRSVKKRCGKVLEVYGGHIENFL